jgi:6-phosphogluconolactonase
MANPKVLLFVGTYTQKEGHVDGKAKGISILEFDLSNGSINALPKVPVAEIPGPNPSFICVHPHGRYLFAVSENSKGAGPLVSFSVDPLTGELKRINETSCRGESGCYLKVDSHTGRHLLVANYGGGNLLSFKIDSETGIIEEEPQDHVQHPHSEAIRSDPNRQCQAHAHSINDWTSPDGEHSLVFSCDLGLDRIYRYRLDRDNGKLHPLGFTPIPNPGAGPRHIDFHPQKPIAYVICELDSTISAFSISLDFSSPDKHGALSHLQTISTLPEENGWSGSRNRSHCADIHVHPSGRFLYASNRGHDSIAIFSLENEGK